MAPGNIGRNRSATAGRSRVTIDAERLVNWTYEDQVADLVSGGILPAGIKGRRFPLGPRAKGTLRSGAGSCRRAQRVSRPLAIAVLQAGGRHPRPRGRGSSLGAPKPTRSGWRSGTMTRVLKASLVLPMVFGWLSSFVARGGAGCRSHRARANLNAGGSPGSIIRALTMLLLSTEKKFAKTLVIARNPGASEESTLHGQIFLQNNVAKGNLAIGLLCLFLQ